MISLNPGFRRGKVNPPLSKSHLHRLLIANFLAGDRECLRDDESDAEDVLATKRCLRALATNESRVELDCGESGSTIRFLSPVATALGKVATFKTAGRLAMRPQITYRELKGGLYELEGNVSSQFVTGLLFALPLLAMNSEIRFKSPLESRGYVDMTLQVLRDAGVAIEEVATGFRVAGRQKFVAINPLIADRDWSGAAFWFAANAIGNEIEIPKMNRDSAQPDKRIVDALAIFSRDSRENEIRELNVSQFPDSFPILAIVAGAKKGKTIFTGVERLRIKESDRLFAMADVLSRFGVATENRDKEFIVESTGSRFRGGEFHAFDDHRIAMSIAIGSTFATSEVAIDNEKCVAKSYPTFFSDFTSLVAKYTD